ncbi:hypothetical protein SAMN05421823_103731 [Catalinimonas alkaloidigena]|uniref:Catalase n=1 Tax=Catalinimonas alkaloidigena TaxID=1075417 RepID=A0A1G9FBR8_9BACT|nr:catalase family protein [Catalinimonas alkaloidigena]SDK85800.1 hypothetical protein SAMN05421823_103731 [Catalinimonas alkaloidigena]
MPPLQLGQESPPPGEAADITAMIALMKASLAKRYAPGETLRQFHPKMHGCVRAELTVDADLPEHLRQGLFREHKTYQAWVRFSNAPPKVQSDAKASGRGMAIKVLEVGEASLVDDPIGVPTQDFLLTTSPVLSPGNARNYRQALYGLVHGFPHNLPYVFNPGNWRRLALTLRFMKKHADLLTLSYFSGSPFRLGGEGTAVKFSARPLYAPLVERPRRPAPDFLRQRLVDHLATQDATFTFLVQPQTDPVREPIEDTSRIWHAPFYRVGTLRIPSQEFDTEARRTFGENLSFSPWHSLPTHRPLGGINRVRRAVYEELAAFRMQQKGVEPSSLQ